MHAYFISQHHRAYTTSIYTIQKKECPAHLLILWWCIKLEIFLGNSLIIQKRRAPNVICFFVFVFLHIVHWSSLLRKNCISIIILSGFCNMHEYIITKRNNELCKFDNNVNLSFQKLYYHHKHFCRWRGFAAEHQSQYDVFGMVPKDSTKLSRQNLLWRAARLSFALEKSLLYWQKRGFY